MSVEELEEDYAAHLERTGRFYGLKKVEMALLLARLCVLEPHLQEQIAVEMPAIKLVGPYTKTQLKDLGYDNENKK